MNPVAKVLVFIDCVHNVGMKVPRKGSRELDPLHAGRSRGPQQPAKWRRPLEAFQARLGLRTITVHVLPDQVNLAIASGAQLVYLGNDLRCRAALFSPTRERNDAVGAKLVTAFDDGNE